jgi:dihydroneopterin aldolase
MTDKILIHDASFHTIIGINEEERAAPRELILDIELFVNITNAAQKDHKAVFCSRSLCSH